MTAAGRCSFHSSGLRPKASAYNSLNIAASSFASSSSSTTSDSPPTDPAETTTAKFQSLRGEYSYRLNVQYDGTAYNGWQIQPGLPTIQGEIERVLYIVTQEPLIVHQTSAAGRTDAGVHARGQVVQFFSNKNMDLDKLLFSFGRLLPKDIRVQQAFTGPPGWWATTSAVAKTYHYTIDTQPLHDPLLYRYRYHVPKPLDVDAMHSTLALLRGTHDFMQFCNFSQDTGKRDPVRTISHFDLVPVEGGLQFQVRGNGFLYRMVRHMVGATITVGLGRLKVEDVADKLETGSSVPPGDGGKSRGWNIAPSKGLLMHSVEYPPEFDPST